MDQLLIVVPLGLLLLCVIAPLLRFGEFFAARSWAVAWMLIYADGVFSGFSLESMTSLFVAQLGGLAFAVAIFVGARSLNGHATPLWIVAGAFLAGVLLMIVNISSGYASVSVSAGLVQGPLLIAAAVSLWRGARSNAPLEIALAGVLVLLAANEMFDFMLIQSGERLLGLGIWITVGLSTAILQVGVLADRARQREATARATLEGERANMLDMLAAVPVGIILEGAKGEIQLINPPMAEQLGVDDASRFQGKPFGALARVVFPNFSAESQDLFSRVRVDDPETVPREVEVRFDRPKPRVLTVSILPIDTSDPRSRRRVWVSRDVTEERRMAESFQEAERMETVGTLAGGLAHDFNNQLTAILGNATLMRDALPDEPRMRRRVDDLVRSAEHCAELTAGLLAFARRGPTAKDAVDIKTAFSDATRLLRPSLDPEVTLEVSVADDTPPVAADASELRRVITNVLLNARDAVEGQGRIRLAARPAPGRPSWVEISVEDDGVGIDTVSQRHVFDPFFTTKKGRGGTGLGLSIVYGIAQAHGAELDVQSTRGAGARFRVYWPASSMREVVEPSRAPVAAYRSRPSTILVAEDEPAVRRLARQVLEGGGYRVLEASDGAMAVRTFADHRDEIDLVLLDLSMPNATGLEALAEMRREMPGLRALIMSGHPTREGVGDWPGDVPLLKKPCAPAAMLSAVASALRPASAAVPAG